MEQSLDTDLDTGSFKEKQDPYQDDSELDARAKDSVLSQRI